MSKNYFFLCTACFVLTIVAFLVALMNPATGYEISIYASTPLSFWILVILSIIICVLILAKEALNGEGRSWLFPLGILMLNGMVVLSLSVVRGYYAVGSDTLMHIGYVKDLTNGVISTQNAYPVVHVVPALFVFLGVSPVLAVNLMPIVVYVVYVTSFYFLAKVLWENKRMVIISTTLSAMLLLPMGVGLAASLVAAAIFPLTLLILMKMRADFNVRHIVVFCVFMAIISLLHPLALEAVLIALAVMCLVTVRNRWRFVAVFIVVLPLAIWWYNYWFDTNVFGVFIKDLIGSHIASTAQSPSSIGLMQPSVGGALPPIEESGGFSWLPSMAGIQATQVIGQYGVVPLILRRYGSEILLGLLAGISLLVTAKRIRYDFWVAYFGSLFVILNVMWIMGWYLELSAYDLALSRMMNLVPVVSIVLVSPLICKMFNVRKLAGMLVVLLLVVIANGSLFNLYRSPFIGVPNGQVTQQQVDGIAWLLQNKQSDVPIVFLYSGRTSRFVAAMYGVEWVRMHQVEYWWPEGRLPEGFNYYEKQSLGCMYPRDVYFIVTKMDRMMPSWETDGWDLLETDPTATLVYRDDDEFEVWYIKAK